MSKNVSITHAISQITADTMKLNRTGKLTTLSLLKALIQGSLYLYML